MACALKGRADVAIHEISRRLRLQALVVRVAALTGETSIARPGSWQLDGTKLQALQGSRAHRPDAGAAVRHHRSRP